MLMLLLLFLLEKVVISLFFSKVTSDIRGCAEQFDLLQLVMLLWQKLNMYNELGMQH